MKEHKIRKVAVLGSGVMGSRIACHFANIGLEVLLLDIVPDELNDRERAKGLNTDDRAVRDRIADESLHNALKSDPSPIYSKQLAKQIRTGNFEDDLDKLSDCDWILEAIIEKLEIKKDLFSKVEEHRRSGTIISTNTSGIPVQMIAEGRSEDFKKHFCGTHFFNPPRYLELLEIIPGSETDPELLEFLMDFGHRELGKKTVRCKDTPAFIGNRIGVYSIMSLFHLVEDMGLTVNEVDKLTGPVVGRPKSATFRTCDVVGLDTLVHVADDLKKNCPEDEGNSTFEVPDKVRRMVDEEMLGSKSGQGFYKKVKDQDGKSQILELNLQSLEYQDKRKVSFPSLDTAMQADSLGDKIRTLFKADDKAGTFTRRSFLDLFQYASKRIPEIADRLHQVDDAIRAGFGWKLGPFEMWDMIGVKEGVEKMKELGQEPAQWVQDMLDAGFESFYKLEEGIRSCYAIEDKAYLKVPGSEERIVLSDLPEDRTLWSNSEASVQDLGDGVINVAFHSKMNTIGGDVMKAIQQAIDHAEADANIAGVVIGNEGENFSAGANVGMILMMAAEQDFDELDMAVRQFQKTTMRIRYSSVPVVAAPHNLTLGGGCEICMHADKVVAHAETYIGLVEFGAGLIPGGGGTKEFALRASDDMEKGDIRVNTLQNRFLTIGQAKVATSAMEGFEHGYLRRGQDEVVVSRDHHFRVAKKAVLELAEKGYVQPSERKDIRVLGNEGLGIVYSGADSMLSANYITEHDQKISEKLGQVICGGPLSEVTQVSESYLLDLERKAFLELCGEQKTLKRMESIAKTGKPLRN